MTATDQFEQKNNVMFLSLEPKHSHQVTLRVSHFLKMTWLKDNAFYSSQQKLECRFGWTHPGFERGVYFPPLFCFLDKHDNSVGLKNDTFTHIYSLNSVRNTIYFTKIIQLMIWSYKNKIEGLKDTEKMVNYLVV